MSKSVIKLIVIFVIGICGGIFSNQILWPYLVEKPLYQIIDIPSTVTEVKEITIEENTALQNVIEKIEKSVVGVKTTINGKEIFGSGVVVTSDGLIITLNDLVPKGGDFVFYVDGKVPNWQILKRDVENNLILIKLEENDLKTIGFADIDNFRLGQRVFLLGMIFNESKSLLTNEGIIKYFTDEYIRTNMYEKSTLNGSALFNIKGELLGLNTIDTEERVTAISISKIREFIGY
jgi:S1-C subfamily serine protease